MCPGCSTCRRFYYVCIFRCTRDVPHFIVSPTCFQFVVDSESLILEDCIRLNAYCVDLTRKLFRIKFLNSFIHHLSSVVKSLLCVRQGCAQRTIRIHIRQQINQNVYQTLADSSLSNQASHPKYPFTGSGISRREIYSVYVSRNRQTCHWWRGRNMWASTELGEDLTLKQTLNWVSKGEGMDLGLLGPETSMSVFFLWRIESNTFSMLVDIPLLAWGWPRCGL